MVVGSSPTVGDFALILSYGSADTAFVGSCLRAASPRFVLGASQRERRERSSENWIRQAEDVRLHRLAVRTSRCGRDDPGSNPGVDIFAR